MAEASPFEAIVEQILSGNAAQQARIAAARGALPLPRASLVRLYLALRDDEDPEIRSTAEQSLQGLGPEEIREVLEDEACASEVLGHYATSAVKDEVLAERIAFHRNVPGSAMLTLAGNGTAKVLDLVLTNQERLLTQPELLDRLAGNPALRTDQRGRILELLERLVRAKERAEAAGDEAEAMKDVPQVEAEFDVTARLLEIDVGELFSASEIEGGEELEQAPDPDIRNAYKRICKMNTAQKAILALRGNREERMILIRDTNRLVAMGVLRNGRIQEDDIESIARMRNVSSDVLREIGQTRDWTKSPSIVLALTNNPRTPPGTSTNFISRLQNQDLKRLAGSHEVPELIRRMAKKTLETRTQRTGAFKKK